MGEIVDLVNWTVNLAFYARVSTGSPTLVLENWPRNILIALEAFIKLAVYHEGSFQQQSHHANESTVLLGIKSVPVPNLRAGIGKT